MNLMTKYELGEIVTSVLDPMIKMQITKITIYLDGGYQYETARFYDGGYQYETARFYDGQLYVSNWFEGELEAID